MSIKPQSFDTTSPVVWSGGVLDVHGRDAQAFLHAQLMSDVKALVPGAWQWTGWLTAKGRVIALGALRRLEEDRFRLFLPDHPAGELGEKAAALRVPLEADVRNAGAGRSAVFVRRNPTAWTSAIAGWAWVNP